MDKSKIFYIFIILILTISNCFFYLKYTEFEQNPLNKLSNIEKMKLLDKLITQNNISPSNQFYNKKANRTYFYLEYNQNLHIIKIYKFEDGQKYYDDIDEFDIKTLK